ncbi:MAG TPA: radical SAM protein [Sedimentisphaerales bacterium]|nr:radical SAM protein [Sedimentisphaerales bacterium]
MRVLLIEPPFQRFTGLKCDWFPLGLGYVASTLRSRGFCVRIYNAEFHTKPQYLRYAKMLDRSQNYCNALEDEDHPIWLEVRDVIESFCPDVVGLTVKTPKLNSARRIAEICKSIDKGIVVVAGGPHPTVLPEEVVGDENIDYAVRGEGEVTMLELVEALQGRRALDDIDGISYRRRSAICHNKNRALISDLDNNPLPSKELLIDAGSLDTEAFGDIITSRGCPFRCAYCAAHLTWTRNVRYRSISNIIEEIRAVIDAYGTTQFTLWDDSFTLNRKRTIEFCEALRRERLKINWACNTRFDLLDEEIITRLKEAGCNNVELGVESGSARMLRLVRKGISIDKIKNMGNILRKNNLYWSGFFMIGLPTETPDDIRATIELMKMLKPNYSTFSIFTPYPGTELYEMLLDDGAIGENTQWHLYNHQSRRNNFTGVIDNEQFKELVDEASLAFDANNNRFSNLYSRALSKAAVYSSSPTELLRDAKKYLNYAGVLGKR